MSTLTSTLAIRVDDAGLASRLRADAEALKKFGASASQIKATAGGADLLKQFGNLQATAGKLDGFAAASKGLDGLGARLRAARDEVGKTARALVAAERKAAFFDRSKASGSSNYPGFVGSGAVAEAAAGLKAARRANAAAIRAAAGVEDAFTRQRTAVRAAGHEIERAGTPLASLSKAQHHVRAEVEDATASIRRQLQAHEDHGTAATVVETRRRAVAQLRATVQGAEADRRAAQDRTALKAAEARPHIQQQAWAALILAVIRNIVPSSLRSTTCKPPWTDGIDRFEIDIALPSGQHPNQRSNDPAALK